MKKILALALLVSGIAAKAQDFKKYSFGFSGAVNFSTFMKHVDDYGYRVGAMPSVFMEARLYSGAYLHAGLGYNMMGGTYQPLDKEDTMPFTEREVKLGYLDLPVTYRVYVENKKFFLEAGPHFSLLLHDDVQETVVEEGVTTKGPSNLKVRSFDIGGIMALGWRFNEHWAVQANLVAGSYNLFLNDGPAKVLNQEIQLQLSYYL
jgi:Outer membrane protein beta-barrel domain